MRVLFDMDGVLVDVSGSFRRAVIETAEALSGYRPTPAEVQAYKDRGGFNNDWVLTHTIVREAGREVPYEEVIEAFNARYRGAAWDGLITGEPAMVRTETLERLATRGPLALVTGRQEAEARFTLRRFGWEGLFPVVVAMEHQAGREKPDPYPLVLALAALAEGDGAALDPATTVYAGDTVDDVRAARAAGVVPIGIVPPYLDADRHRQTLLAAGAEVVLTDVNALPEAVDALASRA
jgi:HAD superfamily phosphatase